MTEPERPQSFEPDWASAQGMPLLPINQFVTQIGPGSGPGQVPDGIYLTLGMAAPPIFLGGPERVAEQLSTFGSRMPVTTVARLVLTRERATEMAQVLATAVSQYDAAVAAGRTAQATDG